MFVGFGAVCMQCFEKRLEAIGPLDAEDLPEAHPSHEPHTPPQGWPPATAAEVRPPPACPGQHCCVGGLPSVVVL